jgi:general secretion pathway protein J
MNALPPMSRPRGRVTFADRRVADQRSRRPPAGFTLLELLVALFIAAIMFAMGYGAINQALRSQGSIHGHQQDLVELETAVRVMEQDFAQLAPRPVRDPLGDQYLPCLQGSPASETADPSDSSDASASSQASDPSQGPPPLIALTRSGWSNPTGLPRPELERVAYVFDNGVLVREHWNALDPTLASTPVRRNLLKHLRNVTFRYMSPTHTWVDIWPPTITVVSGGGLPDSAFRMRPLAVEVTLDTKQWGKIVRIFEIAN